MKRSEELWKTLKRREGVAKYRAENDSSELLRVLMHAQALISQIDCPDYHQVLKPEKILTRCFSVPEIDRASIL